jgi:hypothetical protein
MTTQRQNAGGLAGGTILIGLAPRTTIASLGAK